jgi:hypothetical protein
MRWLAEFIMRGRLQASVVALLGNLVPLISPAAVALVVLRRNLADAALVLLWAALPVVLIMALGDASPVVAISSIIGLVTVLAAAQVLKVSISWQYALLAMLAVASMATIALGLAMPASLDALLTELQQVLNSLRAESVGDSVPAFSVLMAVAAMGLGLEQVSGTYVLGFLALLTVVNVTASLLLARWWQALLYNPGGFRQEFHRLRLDRAVAGVLMAGMIGCNLAPGDYLTWGGLLGVPILLAGLGVVHGTVQILQLGTHWLVVLYVGLVFLLVPLSMALIGLGFLDSFFDFRTRLAARGRR